MTTKMGPIVAANEECLVKRLRDCGTTSLEDLARLPGLDWVAVFSIIDRLNRAGSVVLYRRGADYHVSLERGS